VTVPGKDEAARDGYDVMAEELLRLQARVEALETENRRLRLAVERVAGGSWVSAETITLYAQKTLADLAARSPGSEERRDDENFAARVDEARRLVDAGDPYAVIAYLLSVPVEDVIRVAGAAAPGSEER